jgi:hypothetical protein
MRPKMALPMSKIETEKDVRYILQSHLGYFSPIKYFSPETVLGIKVYLY